MLSSKVESNDSYLNLRLRHPYYPVVALSTAHSVLTGAIFSK